MVKIIKQDEPNIVWTDDPELKNKPKKNKASIEVIPSEYTLAIRPEKKGRGGKTVSVVYELPQNADDYFKKLVKKIKRECGSGGTFKGDSLEFQGDHILKIKSYLETLGFKVKITGGQY